MRLTFRRKQNQNVKIASSSSLPRRGVDSDRIMSDLLSAQAVASLPPPGLSGPTQLVWSPGSSRYLALVSSTAQTVRQITSPSALYPPLTTTTTTSSKASTNNNNTTTANTTTSTTTERTLLVLDLHRPATALQPLLRLDDVLRTSTSSTNNKRSLEQNNNNNNNNNNNTPLSEESLEERLRRERQRLSWGSSLTQFGWAWTQQKDPYHHTLSSSATLRVLVPVRGNLYIQEGVDAVNNNNNNSNATNSNTLSTRCIYDKSLVAGATSSSAPVDPQLSPDASMVVWTCNGEVYCKSATSQAMDPAIRISYGAVKSDTICISHGIADFVAQEEMDRYRGTWWNPNSQGMLIARVDESPVPLFRIVHYPTNTNMSAVPTMDSAIAVGGSVTQFEDHRYPFAGMHNPTVRLAYVKIDTHSVHRQAESSSKLADDNAMQLSTPPRVTPSAAEVAIRNWNTAVWFDPPREASEYLARVYWLPDGSAAISQWQNRAQNVTLLYRMDLESGKGRTLLIERSDDWINLHHMFVVLARTIHPDECILDAAAEKNIPSTFPSQPLPKGSFSFLFASERTKYMHIYLYTYVPGLNGDQAILLRAISSGDWEVENIAGVDVDKDIVYVTGTYDSVLERHLYALPLTNRGASLTMLSEESPMQQDHDYYNIMANSPNGMRKSITKVINVLSGGKHSKNGSSRVGDDKAGQKRPIRLTAASGMHCIVMDDQCQYFVDTFSDLDRPTKVRVYRLPEHGVDFSSDASQTESSVLFKSLFEAEKDDKAISLLPSSTRSSVPSPMTTVLPSPEIISFPTSDGAETLYAALYRPDPRVHGPGPYPLICAVYGGPHVQRVNRSWSQSADMRAQRLRNLGFCVVKCDNRGSSRRGVAFERAISRQLGRVEVLDQVTAVRQLVMRGIADPTRVGVYGWSYGGYLATMCLCRAPDIFHVAVAGAPVTSWDGYDTHYTERYMGHPSENPSGYRESAVFDHVPNMRGNLMLVHGLIDENVHFRHTSRLINKLTNAGKEYELLVFPDERHSPRRLRDRVYMEQRISDFFVRHLTSSAAASQVDIVDVISQSGGVKRHMVGHL